MARLLVSFQGAEFGFDLRGDGVRVGSGASCGLVLKDPAIGREHFELRRTGPVWRLVDLESASGTRVNGLYVNKQDLKPGDVVAIGAARLTFQADQGPTPAPVPGGAPAAEMAIAVPVPAPIPAAVPAPVPAASPWNYAASPQGAPAPAWSAPVHTPPPPPRRPAPRDRDRDDPRDRRRGPRRQGGGSGAILALVFLLAAGGLVALFTIMGGQSKKADPNLALVERAEASEAKGDFDDVISLESHGDPSFTDSYRRLQYAVIRAKKGLGVRRSIQEVAEADDYYKVQIHDPRESGSRDYAAIVLRCDDFIRRWPTHEKVDAANFVRMSLTGEPSPAWSAAKGGNTPGKGFVSVSALLDAAEDEAGRRVHEGRYVQAYAVYDMFVARSSATVPAERMEEFKASIAKKKLFVELKAKDAYDKVEEKAMVLEDRKQFREAEELFREARENYALGDNIKRCDEEIGRLAGMHR